MIALDTSVIVAALLEWHEAHASCFAAVNQALGAAPAVIVPVPALIEAYSVMTRLPAPHRLSPADANSTLASLRAQVSLASMEDNAVWSSLETWSTSGIAGGRTYDAHILACARRARATAILTLNASDFTALAPSDIAVVTPSQR